jgi:hypothetical protein
MEISGHVRGFACSQLQQLCHKPNTYQEESDLAQRCTLTFDSTDLEYQHSRQKRNAVLSQSGMPPTAMTTRGKKSAMLDVEMANPFPTIQILNAAIPPSHSQKKQLSRHLENIMRTRNKRPPGCMMRKSYAAATAAAMQSTR